MATIPDRQRAIALLETLEEDKLPRAIAALQALAHPALQEKQPQEADLIHIIHQRLPQQQQQRFNELRQRLEAETLTEAERTELLAFTAQVEQQDADRAAALFQLAQLRQVDLTVILDEFSLARSYSNAI
jgi:hypothetical protein